MRTTLQKVLSPGLLALFLAWGLPTLTRADEPEKTEKPERSTVGHIEAGIGSQSEDSAWFGRYTGLTEQGTFVLGDLDIDSRTETGSHTQLVGRRLGLKSQSILLEQGKQGKYKLELRHDELPYYQFGNAVTPYQETEEDLLTLPGSVTDPQYYQPVDLYTHRKRNRAALSLIPAQYWKTSLAYRQENREGTLQTGGGLGYSTRNMALSMLPKPVDYSTDLIDAKLSYARDKGHLELGYHLSMFRNNRQSLTWENPFPELSGNSGSFGQLALEPDNDFQQIMLSSGYQLPKNNYLTAVISSGLMTQDQEFLPYTTNTAIDHAELPRDSLGGEIRQNIAHIKLNSRPQRDWQFNASYRYHDHDNNSPITAYTYPVADSEPPGKTGKDGEDLTATNQPLSYTRHTTRLDGRYRLNRNLSLQLGYDLEDTSRENSEVDETEEHTLWSKFKFKLNPSGFDGWIRAGRITRDGSGYNPAVDGNKLYIDNPLLRKYNLADLERDEFKLQLNYLPMEKFSISANLLYAEDDYTDSLIGLTSANNRSATLEATYTPANRVNTYAYYTRDLIESEQAGRETPPTLTAASFVENHQSDWNAELRDTMDNFGIGAEWQDAIPRFDLGTDYVYAKSRGETEVAHPEATPFPNIKTNLYSLKLWARYRHSQQLSFKLSYWRDRFDVQDWMQDSVSPTSSDYPTSLFMVSDSPDYDVDIAMLSLRFDF